MAGMGIAGLQTGSKTQAVVQGLPESRAQLRPAVPWIHRKVLGTGSAAGTISAGSCSVTQSIPCTLTRAHPPELHPGYLQSTVQEDG